MHHKVFTKIFKIIKNDFYIVLVVTQKHFYKQNAWNDKFHIMSITKATYIKTNIHQEVLFLQRLMDIQLKMLVYFILKEKPRYR